MVTLRATKGSALTHAELDANFTELASPGGISVLAYNATGDGVTDDGPAFRAWWEYLNAQTGPTRGYIPPGKYNLTSLTSRLNLLIDDLTIEGAGSASTVLLKGATYDLFYKASATGQTSNFTMKGFTVQGLGANKALYGSSGNAAELYYIDNLILEDIKITDLSDLAFAARACDRVFASNCSFQRIGRGGFNIADCRQSMTTNCLFWKVGDDSISLHEREGVFVGGSHAVSNCLFYMAQGIKGVGGRSISVTGCNFEFMAGHVLDVESSVVESPEGSSAGMNVVFSGNTVKDVFNNAYTTNHNQGNTAIRLGGDAANATGLDAVPGYPDSLGVIIRPEPYIYNYALSGAVVAVPPNINYVITGNSFLQTLKETTNFSDLGFGEFFGYEGEEVDPEVAYDELLDVNWILIEAYQNNTLIANNVVSGFSRALDLGKAAASNLRLRNFVMQGNILHNLRLCVMECRTSLANDPDGLDIAFRDNLVDLDPYLVNTNRLATGGWASNASNTDGLFMKVRGNDVSAIRVFNNEFRNICSLSGGMKTFGNIFLCEPVSINSYSSSNLGVGLIPQNNRVILIDSDPTSATYGSPITLMDEAATAQPATGTYVEGHFVTNSNPTVAGSASSKYVIRGWLRLTTGTGHVADTDWAEVRTLTGT